MIIKKSVFLILFLIIIPRLLAGGYRDSGLYGSLGFSYLMDKYDDGKSKDSQEKFMQEYKLGYKGNIYSPKLLDYGLEGIFRYENINATNDGSESKTKVDSQGYKIDLNFLKESKIPFRIYAQKSETPTSIIYANTLNQYLGSSDMVGISGSVNLDIFDITYNASNGTEKYESIFSTENRDIQRYGASLRKQEKVYNLQLNYSNINQISERESTQGSKTTTNSVQDQLDFIYKWKISDSLTLDTSSSYAESEYQSTTFISTDTIASATASLMWDPKTKHNGSIYLQGFSTVGDSYSTESLSISQNYGYKISESLRFSQQASYTTVNSGPSVSENIGLGTGLSYFKEINKGTRINVSLNASGSENSNDKDSSLDSSTYSYGGQAGLNQNIDFIDSRLNVNLGYSGSSSTSGSSTERYNTGLSLDTMFFTTVSNRLSTTYSREETTLKYNNNSLSRYISTINVNDNISYTVKVGIKGSLSTNLGVRYSYIEYDTNTITQTVPKGDINFGYTLGQKWRTNNALHVQKDLTYDIMDYSASSSLVFLGKSTKISFGYNYSKVTSSEYLQYSSRERHSFKAEFSRTF